ncbi:MAG: hypothetical protein RI637_12900 [Acidimicrobiia bacterium]|nr:hypothetical protein [Acidimicrobiia bacterium]
MRWRRKLCAERIRLQEIRRGGSHVEDFPISRRAGPGSRSLIAGLSAMTMIPPHKIDLIIDTS